MNDSAEQEIPTLKADSFEFWREGLIWGENQVVPVSHALKLQVARKRRGAREEQLDFFDQMNPSTISSED